jgi:hypothetical protein
MKTFIFSLAVASLVSACSNSDEYNAEDERVRAQTEMATDDFSSPSLPPTNEGFAINAPSDPGVSYRILSIKGMKNGNLEVASRRDGSSGTSFARREIDCGAYIYRYLGEGDSRAEAAADKVNLAKMTALTGNSASSDVANAACKKKK